MEAKIYAAEDPRMPLKMNRSLPFPCTPFTALVALVGNSYRIRPTEHKLLSSVSSDALLIWGCLQQCMKQRLLDTKHVKNDSQLVLHSSQLLPCLRQTFKEKLLSQTSAQDCLWCIYSVYYSPS